MWMYNRGTRLGPIQGLLTGGAMKIAAVGSNHRLKRLHWSSSGFGSQINIGIKSTEITPLEIVYPVYEPIVYASSSV